MCYPNFSAQLPQPVETVQMLSWSVTDVLAWPLVAHAEGTPFGGIHTPGSNVPAMQSRQFLFSDELNR